MSKYYDTVYYGSRGDTDYYGHTTSSESTRPLGHCDYYDTPSHIKFRGDQRTSKSNYLADGNSRSALLAQPEPIALGAYLQKGVGPEGPLNPKNLEYKFRREPDITTAAVVAEVVGHKDLSVINPNKYLADVLKTDQGLDDPDLEETLITNLAQDESPQTKPEIVEHIPRLAKRAIQTWGPNSSQGFNAVNLSKALINLQRTRENSGIQIPAPVVMA